MFPFYAVVAAMPFTVSITLSQLPPHIRAMSSGEYLRRSSIRVKFIISLLSAIPLTPPSPSKSVPMPT